MNGQDQESRNAGRRQDHGLLDSPAYGYTVGRIANTGMYQGQLKSWDRRALFIKPGFVVLDDVLSAEKPARLDWLLHTVADISVDGPDQSFSLTSGQASLRGRFITPRVGLQVKKGYPVEPVMGYSTNPVPPEKYVDEWTLTATPSEAQAEESFLSVLQVSRAGEPAAGIEEVETSGGVGAHGPSDGHRHRDLAP